MKKILGILAVSFLMLGFAACDIIDEPYKKDNGGSSSNSSGNSGSEPGTTIVKKHVLLEDYTGVKCPNCPAAGELALNLQEQYGHDLIVLSVHAGSMSIPQPGNYPNFMTTDGTAWYTQFGFDSNPVGTINRKLNGGIYAFQSTEWADAVATALQEEALLEMKSDIKYNSSDRNLTVDVTSKFLTEMSDIYSIVVCIMEDSIVGKQQVNGIGDVEDFMHRHVFRGTINGTWGEEINAEPITPEQEIVKSYSVTLNEAFNEDQCYIIAYIANSETKEILQVVEKKIK